MKSKNFNEIKVFLEKNPDICEFDVLLPDSNAILRGKRVTKEKIFSIYQNGMYFPASIFAMDVTGETMEETGLGIESGDKDILCFPIAETLFPVPWEKDRAQVLLQMFDIHSKPFFGNPREVLKKIKNKLLESGLKAVIALEIEFYITEPKRKKFHPPQFVKFSENGQIETEGQLYSLSSLDKYQSFIKDISKYSELQNVPTDSVLSELSPGQFEINLHHVKDPIVACDHAILLKRIIRSTAKKHKLEVTFMAKPFENEAGSGMHVHLSIINEKGKNIFQGKDDKGSLELLYAIEGLRSTLSESMLFFAPHANSYHRFHCDSYAPINSCWGYNNRTVSLRIPASDRENSRIEHRIAGADANPYLLVCAILSGIHYGINLKKLPPAPIEGNAYLQKNNNIPNSWEESRKCFENSQIISDYFGKDFCNLFSKLKLGEQSRFLNKIKPLEYDWYLKTV